MEFLVEAFSVIFEKVFDYTIGAVGRQIRYPIDYKSNVENLQRKVVEIKATKRTVEGKVVKATRNVEKIEDNVQMWLTDVEEIMAKVGKFFEDEGQAAMKCCNGQCPNLKARYQLSKRAYKLGLDLKEINDRGRFSTVGYREPIPVIGTTISTEGYEDFESRKSIFEGVLEALKDENIHAIGVYGMGGTGKTMLVEKVAKQAREEMLFNEVVKIVLSQTPNLETIQKKIAEDLGLNFANETDSEKAHLLHQRLNPRDEVVEIVVSQTPNLETIQKKIAEDLGLNFADETDSEKVHLLDQRLNPRDQQLNPREKKILIIIDDIWKEDDLKRLKDCGISFEDDKKKCKILLTSRSIDVLRAQKIFPVGVLLTVQVLLDNEATDLFRKIVGDIVERSNFQSIVAEVIEECGGLPIAITTVAHALKSKTAEHDWKDALRELRMANPINTEGVHEKVYASIKLSYNVLSKEAQSVFLFCSTFQEDVDIPIEFLWRLLVGLDFFQDVFTMEEVRDKVYRLVGKLKACCLLLEGEKSGTVKMHDVIRDVSIYIADKDEKMLTIRSSNNLKNLMNSKVLEDSILMALYDFDSSELPERLECPQVKLIILERQRDALQIQNTFFEGVNNLKVLVLRGVCLTKLPSSLLLLDNLQTLYLIGCELEDIAMIGELKNLNALSLFGSNIRQLPKEIEQLTNLKLLDLTDCSQLRVIPPNVLSNLKKLEELCMKRSFVEWENEEQGMKRRNARISDLDDLSHLTTLQIKIPNVKILSKFLFLEKLERYEILIGDIWDWCWDYGVSKDKPERKLKLCLDRSFQLEVGIKKILKSCECLCLGKTEGFDYIPDEDFPKLKYLSTWVNTELQYISWTGVPRVAFPLLESINLYCTIKLEKICHGQLAEGSFGNLRKLRVWSCDSLRFMFSSSVVGYFSKLQEIEIRHCRGMSAIVAKESEEEIEINDITTNTMEFPQLRCLRITALPSLMGFYSRVDSHLLFNEKVGFPKLEEIYINDIDNLMIIWQNQLVPHSFYKLKKLKVHRCENLKKVFPDNMLRMIQNLKELEISNCASVEEIFEINGVNVEETIDTVASKLRKDTFLLRVLKLSEMPNLLHLWNENSQPGSTFQNLVVLEVSKCVRLKNLLPSLISFQNLRDLKVSEFHQLSYLVSSTAKSLVQLWKLVITECNRMTEIVRDEGKDEAKDEISFSQLKYLELHSLPSLNGFNLSNHTIRFPSLTEVIVTGCPELKIFSNGVLSTPQLTMVELAEDSEKDQWGGGYKPINSKRLWEGDLNTTIKRFWEDHFPTCIQQLFIEKDTFPNLEELMMDCDCSEPLAEFFRKQHVCELFKYRGFSSAFAQGLCNLKKLHVVGHSFVEEICLYGLFNKDGQGSRESDLSEMDYLLHLWNENSQPGRTFQNLEYLKVSTCGRLKNLVPSSISFQNLKSLALCKCHGLSCLVTPSVAKSLVQLWKLVITECNQMTEIVTDERGDETGNEISFSQLKYLELHYLPRLKGFNLSNHTIRFPLLKNVIVTRCPELKIFSNGVLSTPQLTKVELAEDDKKDSWGYYQPINGKKLWEGDLNTTIKRFWEDNFDTCIQQLFTEKANESTGEDE